ncbi:peptide-methionine (S)-S-oxide reductase MsrA [Sulfurimonas sp. HSL-3221]|uniref:peptide-methionine (S)-S-oxide reductase MsrA n=1 Tax=Sulfurimonadaceae TaxID=2771471 RepID=UPI001E51A6C7|nr:peptide-methionine (S)-S-oxide reductase MsrA [Sulfurimonas sp. HSL-3221]UFS62788.1 peptide-methionine (S)-S-oxide reductase MsrA [Sulfurimonas sp. HSL-3221]
MAKEVALLGGGCFWCIEAVYRRVKGVSSAISGYAGGATEHPDYRAVCSGTTGHAEVVEVTFDPDVISFGEILDIFWVIHDPTTLNRQGADVGTQYRSVIYYYNDVQKAEAEAAIAAAQTGFSDPIVTELSPAPTFYPAEAYHQNYFDLNPQQGYCQVVIAPKVQKFMRTFQEKIDV